MAKQKTAAAKKTAEKTLAELTLEEIGSLPDDAAAKLCVQHDLPLDVTPTIMRRQLEAMKVAGKPGVYAGGLTLCPVCRHLARCRGEKFRVGNSVGRRLVCTGRRRHSFVAYAEH